MKEYDYNPAEVFGVIEKHWKNWSAETGIENWVVGISGGIDSTCVAALAVRIFGAGRVTGVSLPCDGQADMADVDRVFAELGIRRVTIDVGDAFRSILDGVENNSLVPGYDAKTNLPPRLRMSALYAVAQSLDRATVVNTCNISETMQGYDTLFGDSAGSYAPIQKLTKTEVRALAKWLGISDALSGKISTDGLQPLTDEEKLGITYEKLDRLIRLNEGTGSDRKLVSDRYEKNRFKIDIISIAHPEFGFPNHVERPAGS